MTAEWHVSATPPGDWNTLLQRCGGGFFHTPAAIGISLPEGEVFYAVAQNGKGLQAVALGIRTLCRLSPVRRHVVLATPPATRSGVDPAAAAHHLARALAADGAAEVAMHSYDAPSPSHGAYSRIEHRVALNGSTAAQLLDNCSATHRRHIRRGERAGWTVHVLAGMQAVELLYSVQLEAAVRAQQRNERITAIPAHAAATPASLSAPWGNCCYAAYARDVLLGVVLIGWANGRVFYLLGGSTLEGYEQSAAAWLQWQIMQRCVEAGHHLYNLGGTPIGAEAPTHSSHGLYRFKSGFGATPVGCQGNDWVFRSAHLRVHRLLTRGAHYTRRRLSHHNSE